LISYAQQRGGPQLIIQVYQMGNFCMKNIKKSFQLLILYSTSDRRINEHGELVK